MIVRFFLIVVAFHFSVVAYSFTISADVLNGQLKQNYSFVERSLHQSDLKIETSSGKIFFDDEGVTINVISPFEENYTIKGDTIEIHDVYLDQIQIINIKELNNFFLNLFSSIPDKPNRLSSSFRISLDDISFKDKDTNV